MGCNPHPAAAAASKPRYHPMDFWSWLKLRLGAGDPRRAGPYEEEARAPGEQQHRDLKRLYLIIGLGALSWVATYVGMLELIESNLGDLPFVHKIIIGFSVAMLMTMIIWLLDKMFAPTDAFTKVCYIAGYLFLSLISVGFGFGFYWKVLESRGEASRSAESAITQVQSALFGASTRLEQLLSTLDQLTTISAEKAEIERASGKSCPNSGPGDGPRRKMREEDAGRFKFAADFVKGRISTVKSDMAALDSDLQKIVKDDRSVIDARTGNRNEFLRGIARKLDLTVTGFNAFRSDPQLKQIRIDLADRAEKTTITGAKGIAISCPDGQLQMALRGVVRAIDQLPELTKPQVAAVEGSEATIEAFRRLTTTFFGLLGCTGHSSGWPRQARLCPPSSCHLCGSLPPARFHRPPGQPIHGPRTQHARSRRWTRLPDPGTLPRHPRRRRCRATFRGVSRRDLRSQRPLPRRRPAEHSKACGELRSARARGASARQPMLRARRQRHPLAAHELSAGAPGPSPTQAPGKQVREVLRPPATRALSTRLGRRPLRVV